jgi:hypothetical protein
MNDQETNVEVVTPLDTVKAIACLIIFGAMLGFVMGLGYVHTTPASVHTTPASIYGNVTITPSGQGAVLSNINIVPQTQADSAIYVGKDGSVTLGGKKP